MVLTGRISKVCSAPAFSVMVSLSLAAAAESDVNTETQTEQQSEVSLSGQEHLQLQAAHLLHAVQQVNLSHLLL